MAEFQKATKTVKDPGLQGWASKTVPVLEEHLKQAKDIAQKQGIDPNQAEQEGRKEAEKKEKEKS